MVMNSRNYLLSVALLYMVSVLGQAPSPGEQRTFYRETRNSNSTEKGRILFLRKPGGARGLIPVITKFQEEAENLSCIPLKGKNNTILMALLRRQCI
jgi:hypothetical protein